MPEVWTEEDQAQLTSLLLEAEEAVRTCIRCAQQLLDGSAPDEAVRAALAAAAYERGMNAAPTLRSLSAKALRIHRRDNASS